MAVGGLELASDQLDGWETCFSSDDLTDNCRRSIWYCRGDAGFPGRVTERRHIAGELPVGCLHG